MKNTSLIPLREGNSRVFSREEVEKDSSMKDEIEDKFYSRLPTSNKEETIELNEHILSDEELRIFLDESF